MPSDWWFLSPVVRMLVLGVSINLCLCLKDQAMCLSDDCTVAGFSSLSRGSLWGKNGIKRQWPDQLTVIGCTCVDHSEGHYWMSLAVWWELPGLLWTPICLLCCMCFTVGHVFFPEEFSEGQTRGSSDMPVAGWFHHGISQDCVSPFYTVWDILTKNKQNPTTISVSITCNTLYELRISLITPVYPFRLETVNNKWDL